jgi:hypothetical protein
MPPPLLLDPGTRPGARSEDPFGIRERCSWERWPLAGIRLRQDERRADSTLIALTGYGQGGDFERSRAAGFDPHLVKPVDVAQLEKLLRSADGSIDGEP